MKKRAQTLVEAARHSVGTKDGTTTARIEIRMLLEDYESRNNRLQEVMLLIKELVKQIPMAEKLMEIKGVGIKAVSGFLAEVGDITRFSSPKELQKLAGLALVENSSGKHKGQTTISRRGRKRLRYLLFEVAMSLVGKNPEFGALHHYYTTRKDTQFNEKVYFHEWVEYKNLLDPNIPLSRKDYEHGTAVSYIIVDGPQGNPELADGCGRFRVRHFGVATNNGFSSFTVLKMIRNIVASNRDIKVWNLSLGSKLEIKPNFISPEAAELDRIQSEYDVIFVVAGTNIPAGVTKKNMRIGSPADSLNSMVVNAVDFAGNSASYTRIGPVLSFFHKPDVSYYGGDGTVYTDKMVVCKDDMGAAYVAGTSFAAPWISRKLAYLIHIMGLSREVAKALLIDAAAGWNRRDDISHRIGYGVVPKHINEVLKTPDDEIRFIMTGASEEYETYTYNLPVPVVDHAHPFYARATLAYFPQCDRKQGVDYTSTEMDIQFGRVVAKRGSTMIKAIDDNRQSEEKQITLYEEDARKMYRKWDNVKHISEKIKEKRVPRKAYDSGLWGLKINTKECLQKRKDSLPFGVVVTLKEMNGVNRIDDFVKMCLARGWLVQRLDIENQLDLYAKAEEEIEFE